MSSRSVMRSTEGAGTYKKVYRVEKALLVATHRIEDLRQMNVRQVLGWARVHVQD